MTDTQPATDMPPATESRGVALVRSISCVILIILAVVCLTLSPLAVWGRTLVLDTDGYVSTVAPLASDPQVQDAIIAAVVKQVDTHLDVEAYVQQALKEVSERTSLSDNPQAAALIQEAAKRLAPALKKAVLSLVSTLTTRFVQSSQFQQLWTQINRAAHEQIVSLLLTGQTQNGVIKIQNHNVVLDLSAVVSVVKQKLVDAGVGIAAHIPTFGATIVIAHVQDFDRVQAGVGGLNAGADILPWLGLFFAGLAVLLAHRRVRAVIALGLGLAGGMCVLAVALQVAEHVLADELVQNGLQASTGTIVYDIVIRELRGTVRVILVVALLVATAAWTARFVPSIHVPTGMRDRVLSVYRTPVPRFIHRWATPLDVAFVAVPAAILILIDNVSGTAVIIVAILVAIVVALIESCRRLAPPEELAPTTSTVVAAAEAPETPPVQPDAP